TGIGTTSYTNTGLTNGTAYYFVVTATNSSGTSGNSAQASATPVNGNTHSGTWAMKLVSTNPAGWKNDNQVANCTTNTNYVATVWLKGTGGVVLRVMNGNWGTEISRVVANATSTWTQFSMNIATGANTQLTYVFSDGDGVAGTCYID